MTFFPLTFFGLGLSSLLFIFAMAAAVAMGLYILRLRRRRWVVPFLGIWETFLLERKASALRSRLQRLLSLLLTLLLLLALALSLGDPRPEVEDEEGRHFVLIMDVSASMNEPANSGQRLSKAKQEALSLLEKWGPSDRVLVIEMGSVARPLGPFSAPQDGWAADIEALRPLDTEANLSGALSLAKAALRGKERAHVIVVSDGALPDPGSAERTEPLEISLLTVAEPEAPLTGSVGITHFAGRRYPAALGRFEILVEIENFSTAEEARVELSLFQAEADGRQGPLLSVKKLLLDPGERYTESFSDLPQAEQGLLARLARLDGVSERFSGDDVARTLLSPLPKLRVLILGEPNNFLEAALLADDSVVLSRTSVADYPPKGTYDVTVFDGAFPERVKQTGAALYLGAPSEPEAPYPVAFGKSIESFGFDTWEKDSPVFHLLDPYSVQVLSGNVLSPGPLDSVLAKSEGRPLLISGSREEGPFLALGFSPKNSDFVLRPVFPLFLHNALEFLSPRTLGSSVFGLRTGTEWRIPVPFENAEAVTVRGPLEASQPGEVSVHVKDGRAVLFGERAGFFEMKGAGGTSRFASSLLRTEEALLAPSRELKLAGGRVVSPPKPFQKRADRPLWFWLLLGVFAVSFLEWWAYHRRMTV